MDISLQKIDEVNAKLTVKVGQVDYADNLTKALKKLKQKVNMPGFRKGMVPMSLIQKMYGTESKAEELQKVVSEGINNYVKEQNLDLIASPLASKDEEKWDIEHQEDFELHFDLGFAPAFEIELTDEDKIDFYDIEVSDEQVKEQIDGFRRRSGKFEEVPDYQEDDMMRGSLTEVDDNGNEVENSLKVDEASIMPKYFSNEDQKKLFKDAKPASDIVFSVYKAYDGRDSEICSLLKIKKEEVSNHQGNFQYHINTISRMKLAEVDQALFDGILGKDVVKSEEEFRTRVKQDMENVYAEDSNYKFILDVKDYCLKKVGELKFPEETMKREYLAEAKTEEDKKKIEDQFADILKDREWSLICSKLMDKLGVKIDEAKLKDAARVVAKSQFAQYGMTNIPDEYVENYVMEMLKDEKQQQRLVGRAVDMELTKAVKNIVKLNNKKISVKDFNKMFE